VNGVHDPGFYTCFLSHEPAHQVNIQSFQTGLDLAGHLNTLAGGIQFLWEPDLADDKGIKDYLAVLNPWLGRKNTSCKFSLSIPLLPGLDWNLLEAALPDLYDKGLAMIHWQMDEPGRELPRALLWTVSKLGVWNHVSGRNLFKPGLFPDHAWVAGTPNVVHSFEDRAATSSEAAVKAPGSLLSYGKLPPLPGTPLWQIIRDPGRLLPCLGKISKHELLRLRLDEVTGETYCLGTHLEYFFKKPHEVPGDLMEEIIAMVDAGGSVDTTHVRANLKRAYLIGYALENGCVAGNSSLKHPRQIFIDRLRGMTGLDFTNCVERGYTSVRPEYRAMGIGAKLLEGLTVRAVDVKIFSIISEDNLATQKIALRNKTRKITTYFSDKLEKKMGVWMPEHMIPKKWNSDK